ncbi:MAG: D-glycerate dehydrogenase [Anaerolineae bacterium]|nr:D-glycerate dehydrogenase [Anaerolineae bacterium]
MTRPRVFITRVIPEEGLALLRDACMIDLWEDELPPPYDILQRRTAEADGLLCLLSDRIDAALLEAAPRLRVISQMAVGYDNIDIAACTAHGLPVGHTPGVLTETTADFAFALLMAAARRIPEAERYARAGRWKTWGPTLLLGRDIHGATLGIIGMGRIGQAVARRARGFAMRLLYTDRAEVPEAAALGAEYRPLDALLAESDFVSLHVPLTPETFHLIDARALSLMQPTAILINTARGPVVDHMALYHALTGGQIAAAALDVTDPEPLPPDSPLLRLDNCLVVPHIASASVATRGRMAVMAAENLLAGLRGERLPHPVNPEVFDRRG